MLTIDSYISVNDAVSIDPSVADSATVLNAAVDAEIIPSASNLSPASSGLALDVKEDPTDPDILVLAFQELDLSAGALLYSNETTREDAWCVAVFAGLGEKAVLYDKVSATFASVN